MMDCSTAHPYKKKEVFMARLSRNLSLRLYEDTLAANAPPVYLPATPRAIYVREGGATLETGLGGRWVDAGAAEVTEDVVTISVGSEPTVLWRWELVEGSIAVSEALPSAPSAGTQVKLVADVVLDDRFQWLMRCDSVSFPPGGVALTHVHQGPGIRICLSGEIRIETNGSVGTYPPGCAWFEEGPLAVLAPTTDMSPTTFVRCFLLPRELKGKSSIRYVRAEDAQAPKVQTYRVYAERYISVPGAQC
jgi:hypothetical protein